MKSFQPTQLIEAFPPKIQVAARALFPKISEASEIKDAPCIQHVVDAYGEKTAVGWIEAQLVQMAEFVGTKNPLSHKQLNELAFQVRYDYPFLNLLEFILFCARLRTGMYGEFYGSVDPMIIVKALDTFCRERFEDNRKAHNERKALQEKLEREEHDRNLVTPEQMAEIMAKYGYETNK